MTERTGSAAEEPVRGTGGRLSIDPAAPGSGRRAILLSLAVGFALRLTGLETHSFWYDEGACAFAADAPDFVEAMRGRPYPPLALFLLRAWSRASGGSDAGLRLLPALLSCASLVLFARLASAWLAPRARVAAVALYAVSPVNVWLAQEFGAYAFVEFGTVLALGAAAAHLDRRGRESLALAGVALGTGIAAGSHYHGSLAAAALVALALVGWRARPGGGARAARLAAAALLGVAIWTPWFVLVLPEQWRRNVGTQPPLTASRLAELPVRLILIDASVVPGAWRFLGFALGGVLVLGIVGGVAAAVRSPDAGGWRPAASFLAPIGAGLLGAAALPPHYQPKYFLAAAPGAVLLVAEGLTRVSRARVARIAVWLALFGGLGVTLLHKRGNRREDYRAACAELASAWAPGDSVVAISGTPEPFSQAPLRHYLRAREDIRSSIVDARGVLDGTADRPVPGGRLHVVYRDASYASPSLESLRRRFLPEREGPMRFRIQYLRFRAQEPSNR